MSRIVLILVLAVVAVLTVPPLRQRAAPQIEAAMNPLYRWEARNRVNDIYRLLERERAQGSPIPPPRHFHSFLVTRDGADAALDPWHQPYYLAATKRSYHVGSAGQDRMQGTADDIISKSGVTAPGQLGR